MSDIILDTNAYAAFKRGDAVAIDIVQRAARIGLPAVVLGELLGGFAIGSKEATNRAELQQFLANPRVSILNVDEATSDHYASVYRVLRGKGQPIPTNDMWIAAVTLQHGYALFSYDAHFRAVDGLRVGCTPVELWLP